MLDVQNVPIQSPGEAPRKTKLEVFISYAKEDASLVRDITDELKRPFSYLLNFFVDNRSIEDGDEWRKTINDRLESADILLIVSTGHKRESHDFPGFELGYFSRSIKERPNSAGIKRQIIPLIIGGKPPTAILDIQGIIIEADRIYSFDVAPGNLSNENSLQNMPLDNPFTKLLLHLGNIVTRMPESPLNREDLDDLNRKISECAPRLYQKVFSYLRGRVFSEVLPERKLVVWTGLPPLPADGEAVLAQSTIEFLGQSFEVFGLPERPPILTWSAFLSSITAPEVAAQWKEGIRTLVSAALSGMPTDNYYFVSSPKAARSFRLFVSLARTYYSGQRAVHIYIVELAPAKDYGDAKTTKLMKAISIAMRYRSLFLESDSPFSPEIMGFVLAEDFRQRVTELWTELQRILTEARQAELDDPELLSFVYGKGGHTRLDELVVIWAEAEAELNKITHKVIAADADKAPAIKPAFMAKLTHFCDRTAEMNREYAVKALGALQAEIMRKISGPINGADSAPKQDVH
jgi:hypothetical protein